MSNQSDSQYSYLKKQHRQSVVQDVIDCLTAAMINGDLVPGDKIPTEGALSEQLGISRNSVREAIKMLAFLGVLEIRRPEGTFVSDGFSDSMINPMIYGIILNRGDNPNSSLMELREMTEVGVIRLVIDKATDAEIAALKEPLEELKKHCLSPKKDTDAAFQADNVFHDAIMQIGDNVMVSKINSLVRMLTHATRYDTVSRMITSGHGEDLYLAHEAIYQMLCNRERHNLNHAIRETYFLQ